MAGISEITGGQDRPHLLPGLQKVNRLFGKNDLFFFGGRISFADLNSGKPYKGPRISGDLLLSLDKDERGEVTGGTVRVIDQRNVEITRRIIVRGNKEYIEGGDDVQPPSLEELLKAERALRAIAMSSKYDLN